MEIISGPPPKEYKENYVHVYTYPKPTDPNIPLSEINIAGQTGPKSFTFGEMKGKELGSHENAMSKAKLLAEEKGIRLIYSENSCNE